MWLAKIMQTQWRYFAFGHIFEILKLITESDPNDRNLSNSSEPKLRREASSKQPSRGTHMDVDTTVNDLLINVYEMMAPKNNPEGPVRSEFFWKVLRRP